MLVQELMDLCFECGLSVLEGTAQMVPPKLSPDHETAFVFYRVVYSPPVRLEALVCIVLERILLKQQK
jgi:hypothetical protein